MDWMETLASLDCNENPRTVELQSTVHNEDPSLIVRMFNGKPVYRIGQREAETLEDYHCRMQIDLHPIMDRSRQRWLVETVSHGVRDPELRERCKEAAEYYNMYHNFPQYTFWAEHTETALRSGNLRKDETIAQWRDRLFEEEDNRKREQVWWDTIAQVQTKSANANRESSQEPSPVSCEKKNDQRHIQQKSSDAHTELRQMSQPSTSKDGAEKPKEPADARREMMQNFYISTQHALAEVEKGAVKATNSQPAPTTIETMKELKEKPDAKRGRASKKLAPTLSPKKNEPKIEDQRKETHKDEVNPDHQEILRNLPDIYKLVTLQDELAKQNAKHIEGLEAVLTKLINQMENREQTLETERLASTQIHNDLQKKVEMLLKGSLTQSQVVQRHEKLIGVLQREVTALNEKLRLMELENLKTKKQANEESKVVSYAEYYGIENWDAEEELKNEQRYPNPLNAEVRPMISHLVFDPNNERYSEGSNYKRIKRSRRSQFWRRPYLRYKRHWITKPVRPMFKWQPKGLSLHEPLNEDNLASTRTRGITTMEATTSRTSGPSRLLSEGSKQIKTALKTTQQWAKKCLTSRDVGATATASNDGLTREAGVSSSSSQDTDEHNIAKYGNVRIVECFLMSACSSDSESSSCGQTCLAGVEAEVCSNTLPFDSTRSPLTSSCQKYKTRPKSTGRVCHERTTGAYYINSHKNPHTITDRPKRANQRVSRNDSPHRTKQKISFEANTACLKWKPKELRSYNDMTQVSIPDNDPFTSKKGLRTVLNDN